MNGLNISIINNRDDALRYINPVTESEVVLYELLQESEVVAISSDDELTSLQDEMSDLEDSNDQLRADKQKLEDALNYILDAYNKRTGFSRYDIYDESFVNEIADIIEKSA